MTTRHRENLVMLKQNLEAWLDDGDPILRVLRGRGFGVYDVFLAWHDLTSQANDCFCNALHSGASLSLAYSTYQRKKEELAVLLERSFS